MRSGASHPSLTRLHLPLGRNAAYARRPLPIYRSVASLTGPKHRAPPIRLFYREPCAGPNIEELTDGLGVGGAVLLRASLGRWSLEARTVIRTKACIVVTAVALSLSAQADARGITDTPQVIGGPLIYLRRGTETTKTAGLSHARAVCCSPRKTGRLGTTTTAATAPTGGAGAMAVPTGRGNPQRPGPQRWPKQRTPLGPRRRQHGRAPRDGGGLGSRCSVASRAGPNGHSSSSCLVGARSRTKGDRADAVEVLPAKVIDRASARSGRASAIAGRHEKFAVA